MREDTTDGHFRGWSFHLCPDKEEREEFDNVWYGPPCWRMYVNTPWFRLAVALTEKAKFAGRLRPHIREQYSALIALRRLRMEELGLTGPSWRHREDERIASINKAIRDLSTDPKNSYPATWTMWGRIR